MADFEDRDCEMAESVFELLNCFIISQQYEAFHDVFLNIVKDNIYLSDDLLDMFEKTCQNELKDQNILNKYQKTICLYKNNELFEEIGMKAPPKKKPKKRKEVTCSVSVEMQEVKEISPVAYVLSESELGFDIVNQITPKSMKEDKETLKSTDHIEGDENAHFQSAQTDEQRLPSSPITFYFRGNMEDLEETAQKERYQEQDTDHTVAADHRTGGQEVLPRFSLLNRGASQNALHSDLSMLDPTGFSATLSPTFHQQPLRSATAPIPINLLTAAPPRSCLRIYAEIKQQLALMRIPDEVDVDSVGTMQRLAYHVDEMQRCFDDLQLTTSPQTNLTQGKSISSYFCINTLCTSKKKKNKQNH